MINGCVAMLGFWALAAWAYYALLKALALSNPLIWAIGLSLLLLIVLANVHGLVLALKRRAALKRRPNEWRDGEFVGAAGWLSPRHSPLTAPASGQPAALYVFELKRVIRQERNGSKTSRNETSVVGMGMVASEVRGLYGSPRLVGFPVLGEMQAETFSDPASLQRLSRYLLSFAIKPFSQAIGERLGQINAVFGDADGELQECFHENTGDLVLTLEQARERVANQDLETGVQLLQEWLVAQRFTLTEKRIAPNAEVCAFGHYQAAQRQIDIGRGVFNGRDVIPGSLAQVSQRILKRALTWLCVWTLIAGGVHLLAWELAGRPWSGSVAVERP